MQDVVDFKAIKLYNISEIFRSEYENG